MRNLDTLKKIVEK